MDAFGCAGGLCMPNLALSLLQKDCALRPVAVDSSTPIPRIFPTNAKAHDVYVDCVSFLSSLSVCARRALFPPRRCSYL